MFDLFKFDLILRKTCEINAKFLSLKDWLIKKCSVKKLKFSWVKKSTSESIKLKNEKINIGVKLNVNVSSKININN